MSEVARTTLICPGETVPISRAVHLGRLTRFYDKCGTCPHRDDTAGLSARQARQLSEVNEGAAHHLRIVDGAIEGRYLAELNGASLRRIASALAAPLASQGAHQGERGAIAIGIDRDEHEAELVALAVEGLRWANCDAVELGRATAPAVAATVAEGGYSGGMWIGRSAASRADVSLRFWTDGAAPLTGSVELERLQSAAQSGVDRPARYFGSSRRADSSRAYWTELEELSHGLRPLRIAVSCPSREVVAQLTRLLSGTACQVLSCARQAGRNRPTQQHADERAVAETIRRERAHLGFAISADGQSCGVYGDDGRQLIDESLLRLLARRLLDSRRGATDVIVGERLSEVGADLRSLGARVVRAAGGDTAMFDAMSKAGAALGFDEAGRAWYAEHVPMPDALRTVCLLLGILSQSDEPLCRLASAAAADATER